MYYDGGPIIFQDIGACAAVDGVKALSDVDGIVAAAEGGGIVEQAGENHLVIARAELEVLESLEVGDAGAVGEGHNLIGIVEVEAGGLRRPQAIEQHVGARAAVEAVDAAFAVNGVIAGEPLERVTGVVAAQVVTKNGAGEVEALETGVDGL